MKLLISLWAILGVQTMIVGQQNGHFYTYYQPTLPYQTWKGTRYLCVGSNFIRRSFNETKVLASACPKEFYGATDEGVFAGFGNGLFYISSNGHQTILSTATASKMLCVSDNSVLAEFGNGTFAISKTGDQDQLTAAKASLTYGCLWNRGVLQAYGNGLFFMSFQGKSVQMATVKPISIIDVGDKNILACFGNGLFEIDYNGHQKQLSTSCAQ